MIMQKKYIFIAEKPSLMRDVKQCYNKHKEEIFAKIGIIDFIALSGHACCFYTPDDYDEWSGKRWDEIEYPIVPTMWRVKPIERMQKKILQLKNSIDHYDGVIVGTDSDQEGYGIYYLVEQYLQIQNKKALRFVEHSLTDKEILEQLMKMTDFHTDPVHIHYTQSFLLRSRADWLFGMNVTREMSNKTGEVQNVGRVKSPTIKLIYDNSMAIEDFKPEKYFQLQAHYNEDFQAILLNDANKPAKFHSEDEIPCVSCDGVVQKLHKKIKETHAPKLYDLSALQGDAGQFFNMSPSETLEIAQSLYETHKILSYPRTQCRYVSTERAKDFRDMLKKISAFPELKPFAESISENDIRMLYQDKSVVNDKEVQKESHDALLPTSNMPDLKKLNQKEYQICLLVYKRFLAQFLPKLKEEQTQVITAHDNGKYKFYVNGKMVKDLGWRGLYGKLTDSLLPPLVQGQTVTVKNFLKVEKITTPPKRLNQATLLTAMTNIAKQIEDPELRKTLAESKGIGTSATRAAIITEILNAGYAESKKQGLFITQKGKDYITSMKELDIIYPSFAAVMDMKIKKVQRGEEDFQQVYKQVIDNLRTVCNQVENLTVKAKDIGLTCPICANSMRESGYYYLCNKCDFKINKCVCNKQIPPGLMQAIFNGEKTQKYHFRTKAGKDIYAGLAYKDNNLIFDFNSGIRCPFCGKEVTSNRGGYFCDCGLKIFNPIGGKNGKKLTEKQVKELLDKRVLPEMSGFRNKSGEPFSAGLELRNDKTVSFVYQKK